jgi:DNA-binding CsgD family transcriptional regulator
MGVTVRPKGHAGKLETPVLCPEFRRTNGEATMNDRLRGRENEARSLDSFLERAAAAPSVLLLSGEAGIGKTELWQAGLQRARERGMRVLEYRAVEAEAVLSFAGIGELLSPVAADVLPELEPLRQRALEAALLIDGPGGEGAVEPRAIGLAVLDVLESLAVDAPVLVAVDDFQWLDRPSARTLLFALRRLTNERVGALFAVRGEGRELDRGLPAGFIDRLSVGPLAPAVLFQILKERLGLELSPPQLTQLCELAGGNPFFALEVGRELSLVSLAPGHPLPVPRSLREIVGTHLARLPSTCGDVLLLVAGLSRPTVQALVAAHGEREEVLDALEQAAQAGVLELDAERVRFAHPLLASVTYEDAPPWRRREAHARLADVTDDEEERARHLALAAEGPDATVAAVLDAAAPNALARGAPAAAAELSEIAATLTPPGDPSARRRRRLAAAEAHRVAGDNDRARAILDELLAEAPPGEQRADVLFTLARVRRADLPTLARWCETALAEAGEDHRRAAEILAFLSWVRLLEGRVRDALARARAALAHADHSGNKELLARAIARVAMAETWTLEITPGLLERGVEIERIFDCRLEFHESPSVTLARRLMCLSDFDGARPMLEDADNRAKATGDEGTRAHLLFHRFQVEWFTGHWTEADDLATLALELADQLRDDQYRVIALYARALLDAHLGRVEPARTRANEALAIADAVSDALFDVQSRTVLGFLALSQGDAAAADLELHNLPAWLHSNGWREPTDFAWANAIEAMIGTGDLREAETWLSRYEDLAARSGSPWALATAARSRGLLCEAGGDIDGARDALDRALAEHARMHCPFEYGRTLLAAGSIQRRAREKRRARETLEEAHRIFDSLGACLWAVRVQDDLGRISGRRPATGDLTATEASLAALVGEGLSNKQIAAALHISVHTVEGHLTRIYRKLGIRSRVALAQRLISSSLPSASVEAER